MVILIIWDLVLVVLMFFIFVLSACGYGTVITQILETTCLILIILLLMLSVIELSMSTTINLSLNHHHIDIILQNVFRMSHIVNSRRTSVCFLV